MEMADGNTGSSGSSSGYSWAGYSWAELSSTLMSIIFLWSMVQQYLPFQMSELLAPLTRRLLAFVSPYVTVTIDEHASEYFGHNDAYLAAESYLGDKFGGSAARLRAEPADFGSDRVVLALDDHEEVADHFRGARVWWRKASKTVRRRDDHEEERRAYRLTFHRRHRALVESAYLPYVLAEGRAVAERNRQRHLFTNGAGDDEIIGAWTHVKLDHPSTFATLAMDQERKQRIIEDLEMFRDGKDYYKSVGKAWKRGYLLYGPPGTGKSTMIAAMANFLEYDVYDLELTTVKTNTQLRRLFIETTSKSIIVVEDIDCSVDLTGKRGDKKRRRRKKLEEDENGKVTLSGLLNTIDGLWSACGGERIIVFTTNHKEKLDPALIRRGRMDMHIEMSYCCFEGFKVLAKNYLGVTEHDLFGDICRLLEEVDISPADVAENLMARSKKKDVDAILENLVKVLEQAKDAAQAKASLAGSKDDSEDDDSSNDDDDGDSTITDEDNHYDDGREKEDITKKNTKGLFRGLAKLFTCK